MVTKFRGHRSEGNIMTTSNYQQFNGFSIAEDFHRFIESAVIPATALDSASFWNIFTDVLLHVRADQSPTCDTSVSLSNDANVSVPVRDCSQPDNAATPWGSLYEALYNDSFIPHTSGLKPGTGLNAARRERVVSCAKDFLDKTFPLTEGSHRDAVSYMVYFQNLLIILADGTTTGLKQPRQFTGKNGPADDPDSIILEHNGSHTEIMFDRNGRTGATDLACIEDIQLEAANHTVFDFDADSISQKCDVYKTWLQIVKRRPTRTFSNRDGQQSSIEHKNWAITSSASVKPLNNQCAVVLNEAGTSVPEAAIDMLTAAIINSACGEKSKQLNLFFPHTATGITDGFIAKLRELLSGSSLNPATDTVIKVLAASADNPARSNKRTGGDFLRAPDPFTATIGTMQSHGYGVMQAI